MAKSSFNLTISPQQRERIIQRLRERFGIQLSDATNEQLVDVIKEIVGEDVSDTVRPSNGEKNNAAPRWAWDLFR